MEALKIPTAFSPNEDGLNDEFFIEGNCNKKEYSLQIFNRWGELIFSSLDANETWDGRSRAGSFVADGVYFYIFKRAGVALKGNVNVFRE